MLLLLIETFKLSNNKNYTFYYIEKKAFYTLLYEIIKINIILR